MILITNLKSILNLFKMANITNTNNNLKYKIFQPELDNIFILTL